MQTSTTAAPRIVNKKKREMDGDAIYQRIQTAILEHRLLPGAKLPEERLADVTGASRMRIRQVLARLAHEQIITLVPNRGAFVARPTIKEAQEMFEARRIIEPPLVAKLCEQASPDDINALRAHLDQERAAREAGDLRSVIRLSGEFHILLVDMVGNKVLARVIRELTSLTCLIITLYDKPGAPACAQDEHSDLVNLIEAGNAEQAQAHMLHHLHHIEQMLDLDDISREKPDFESIFNAV